MPEIGLCPILSLTFLEKLSSISHLHENIVVVDLRLLCWLKINTGQDGPPTCYYLALFGPFFVAVPLHDRCNDSKSSSHCVNTFIVPSIQQQLDISTRLQGTPSPVTSTPTRQ